MKIRLWIAIAVVAMMAVTAAQAGTTMWFGQDSSSTALSSLTIASNGNLTFGHGAAEGIEVFLRERHLHADRLHLVDGHEGV